MKAKAIFLGTIILFSTLALQGQVKFGIHGGVNFQNINGKDDTGTKFDNGLMVGFHGGFNASVPIAPDFYFQPGLMYSMKGSNNDFGQIIVKASGDFTTITKLSYIEMPLNLLFRPQFSKGHILLGFGPYLAYGVGGSQDTSIGIFSLNQKVKFKNNVTSEDDQVNNAYYRPFDAGANIFCGYEMSIGLYLQLEAQLGLLKINPDYEGTTSDEIKRNTGFGVTAGFRF